MDIVYGYLFGTIYMGETNYKGEGMFQKIQIESGVEYKFSFRFANNFRNVLMLFHIWLYCLQMIV